MTRRNFLRQAEEVPGCGHALHPTDMLDNEQKKELAMPYNFNHLMKLCATHSGGNLSKREVTVCMRVPLIAETDVMRKQSNSIQQNK